MKRRTQRPHPAPGAHPVRRSPKPPPDLEPDPDDALASEISERSELMESEGSPSTAPETPGVEDREGSGSRDADADDAGPAGEIRNG